VDGEGRAAKRLGGAAGRGEARSLLFRRTMRQLGFPGRWPALLLGFLLLGSACGSDDGDGGDDGGDEGGDGGGAGAACAVAETLGAAGAVAEADAERHNEPGSMGEGQVYSLWGSLGDGDYLLVELWDGFGAFSGGAVRTGTFEIGGADAAAESCGACVFVLADVDETGEDAAQVYLAQSGTLVVDSVLPNLTGSLAGLSLHEIDVESDAVLADGCTSTIESVSYDAPVTCFGGGGGTGGGGGAGGGGGGGEGGGEVPCE
jgi:hypothetical protein